MCEGGTAIHRIPTLCLPVCTNVIERDGRLGAVWVEVPSSTSSNVSNADDLPGISIHSLDISSISIHTVFKAGDGIVGLHVVVLILGLKLTPFDRTAIFTHRHKSDYLFTAHILSQAAITMIVDAV